MPRKSNPVQGFKNLSAESHAGTALESGVSDEGPGRAEQPILKLQLTRVHAGASSTVGHSNPVPVSHFCDDVAD